MVTRGWGRRREMFEEIGEMLFKGINSKPSW